MEQLFWKLADLTVSGSIAILGVLAFRWMLRNQAKIFSYLLWIIVGIRLLIPVSFGGVWELMPFLEVHWSEGGIICDALGQTDMSGPFAENHAVPSGGMGNIVPSSGTDNGRLSGSMEDAVPFGSILQEGFAGKNMMMLFLLIWVVGVIFLAAKNIMAYVHLKRKAKICMKEGEYYLSDDISGAFVLGFLKPRIYMSSRLAAEERRYIFFHEKVHLRRRDYLWKGAAECILCVHWFNPLVWIAFRKFTADMEMSCDEAVLRRESRGTRAAYARVLLAEMAGSREENVVPFFQRGGIERRIHNMMKEKLFSKKRAGICAGVVLTAAVLPIPGFWEKKTYGKEAAQEQSEDSVKASDKEEALEEDIIMKENSTGDAKKKLESKMEVEGRDIAFPTASFTYIFEGDAENGPADDVSEASHVVLGEITSDSSNTRITTGGELVNIKYDEKESNRLAKEHGCDMVFTADLEVALDGEGDPKAKTYKDMKWYLSKGKDGQWKIVDADIYHID